MASYYFSPYYDDPYHTKSYNLIFFFSLVGRPNLANAKRSGIPWHALYLKCRHIASKLTGGPMDPIKRRLPLDGFELLT